MGWFGLGQSEGGYALWKSEAKVEPPYGDTREPAGFFVTLWLCIVVSLGLWGLLIGTLWWLLA